MKINLGCGKDIRKGYTNCDIYKREGVMVFDMEKKFPFKDNSIEEVLAYNCLEQVSTPRKFVEVMGEIHRILIDGGRAIVRVPNVKDICAFQDVFDVLKFNEDSFSYMDINSPRYKEFGITYGYKPFHIKLIENSRQLTFELIK
jgi:predicted SAM-dependent methyltransferase